jgi:hypothetical protein
VDGLSEIKVGGEDITHEVCSALADIWQTDLNLAEKEQIELMKATRQEAGADGQRKFMSWGRLRMRVAPSVFNFWAAKLGVECWKDKEFLDYMEKRFGDLVRIKSRSGKETVAVI